MPVPWLDFVKNLETSMTDRFEDAVRDAAQGLSSTSSDVPTYHDAWNRGRRRRMVKRSGLAAAGVVVVLAALTMNLGRFPGADPSEVNDVATRVEAATPVFEPTPLATTSPVEPPAAAPSSEPATSVAIPAPGDPTPNEAAANEAAASESGPESSATTPPALATQAVPTVPPSDPTTVPAGTPDSAEPTAGPTPQPQTSETGPAPTADAQAAVPTPIDDSVQAAKTTQDPDDIAGTPQQPADPGPPDEPQLAFTTAATADATILGGAERGAAIPCDLDHDGLADATCELLVFEYPCRGGSDVRPGYKGMDLDGDELVDTCVVMDITLCDTESDGRGDTPCIIELIPATSGNDAAEQESK